MGHYLLEVVRYGIERWRKQRLAHAGPIRKQQMAFSPIGLQTIPPPIGHLISLSLSPNFVLKRVTVVPYRPRGFRGNYVPALQEEAALQKDVKLLFLYSLLSFRNEGFFALRRFEIK